VEVEFPDAGETLHFAVPTDALEPLVLEPGRPARVDATGEVVVVAACAEGRCQLADGRELAISELWPLPAPASPLAELIHGRIGATEDFRNRLDALRLAELREAEGLGSFLGGRIRLFPHQLYVAEQACRTDPVRWLLADEVGLGKTVEACLIMNRLIHTRRAERMLVVAPETLTVQWLGELWRKHHQVFVLIDPKRLADIVRDFGAGMNPFDVHRRAIVSLELLAENRRLGEQAAAAGIDLLVVDEAHHLRRRPGHPGNAAYRAVAPLAALGRHLLLLTATPLEDDAHGFFRLLQLLRPEALPEDVSIEERLRRREPLPPCTSATRRVDIGGLPPRHGIPVFLGREEGWKILRKLERQARTPPASTPGEKRRKSDRIVRALASPEALAAVLDADEKAMSGELLASAGATDPRRLWLLEQLPGWQRRGEKTLIFVAHRETLEALQEALGARFRVAIFHEDLSTERRDIEVAQFRLADGPMVLVSTECGGEGRNFEFCHRLVLYDLPWNPAVVEQRIGRLDRIGRRRPTEIVYFRPPSGFGMTLAGLYEAIGLFDQPLGGLVRELGHVAREVERQALSAGDDDVDPGAFFEVLEEAREAHDRIREAAYHELHRDPYDPSLATGILERVPEELETFTRALVLRAAARFGFDVEELDSRGTWLIRLGYEALVDRLPGIPAGSELRGTFDRAWAVENEALDFFASGHPLVEGILTELEEGPRGRAAFLNLSGDDDASGLLAIYEQGAGFRVEVVDAAGRSRPDLLAGLLEAESLVSPVASRRLAAQPGWEKGLRRLAAALPTGEVPLAVAAFRMRAVDPPEGRG